jgi:phospholipase D1/2
VTREVDAKTRMPRILQCPRNVWHECPVEGAGLLVDGDDYYRTFYEACQHAERYIMLAGWQFDTDAELLRGKDADGAPLPVTLLKFLDALCERKKDLRIYMLAWDFHAVFSLEREWMQQLRFNWTTNERLHFVFDANHAEQGSHHQKFVVIDGRLSFLGGLDLCDHRWDDRKHVLPNPLRMSRGAPHRPFHDMQAYLVGAPVGVELAKLFTCRWEAAGGAPIEVPDASSTKAFAAFAPRGALGLATRNIALSRTDPSGRPSQSEGCHEICDLYQDAIAGARSLIYIETQYFSSRVIGDALAKRLAEKDGSTLDVVLVLNMEAETFKEEVAVGLAQAKVISDLRKAAVGTTHRLGIYYSVPHMDDMEEGGEEPTRATYIHSKLMIVDDRFLTIGSANLTNRSTSIDTELNMSVETESAADALGRSIARIRQNLLAEHLGPVSVDALSEPRTAGSTSLVGALDDLASRREGRLRLHPSPTANERAILEVIDPQQLPFDPAGLEAHDRDRDRSIFVGGIGALWTLLSGAGSTPSNE